ncbi:LysR family transcriptional regulator [Pseudomonas sp. 148P]|uniref:LysR family transcriptional regulator n=1 Tax=Pseudomonas ulcerans TaxID=3115852 RepID=A0ABU7HVG6_9PSED|nr:MULTISPECIES: LysR family transcriptional regulator [unclassified Pseudomonas]MEE1924136.1 LysR family transcriptional regulator [Pseudomonas sp. 147P]MEE1935537.1 LysR family transcriptional regulator [Pseudomonas sp. 148P]
MDNLSGISVFVQVAETRSFVAAGRQLGVSSSAIGKSIARLEQRLGVRLFHRTTRSINLTAEGTLFLGRCQRVLDELQAAELELSSSSSEPRGKLRVSLPLAGQFLFSLLSGFARRYPEIHLELDFTDRLVDVVEEGFDAVVRTGALDDSRLVARRLGAFRFVLVGAPGYFQAHGLPASASALAEHDCLLYRVPSTGKLERWPLPEQAGNGPQNLRAAMVCNNIDMLVNAALAGRGIACLPEFAVKAALQSGELQAVLTEEVTRTLHFSVLWPPSRFIAPKLRCFVDFISLHL